MSPFFMARPAIPNTKRMHRSETNPSLESINTKIGHITRRFSDMSTTSLSSLSSNCDSEQESAFRSLSPIDRASSALPEPLVRKRANSEADRPAVIRVKVFDTRTGQCLSPPVSPTSSTSSLTSLSKSMPGLRHKRTPRKDTLRDLRVKESDAQLRRLYEQQTLAYLEGSLFPVGHKERNRSTIRQVR